MRPPKPWDNDIYMEVDGYYVYWPTSNGFLSEGILLEIAEDLALRNMAWNANIAIYFDGIDIILVEEKDYAPS